MPLADGWRERNPPESVCLELLLYVLNYFFANRPPSRCVKELGPMGVCVS